MWSSCRCLSQLAIVYRTYEHGYRIDQSTARPLGRIYEVSLPSRRMLYLPPCR